MHFDVVILGGGPGGYVASIRSSKLGMKTALIEKDSLGGMFINNGIIQKISLLKSAKILQIIKNHGCLFGVNNKKLQISFSSIMEKSRNASEKVRKRISFIMKKNNVSVIYGKAQLKKGKKIEIFKDEKGFEEYSASNIIIATGSILNKDEIPLYDGEKIITYKEALSLIKNPKNMIVVGSNEIGLELAYFYHCMGTKVTIIENCKKIFPNGDHDISDYLEASLKKMGIDVLTDYSIEKVQKEKEKVILYIKKRNHDKKLTLISDKILYSIGFIPNTENINLEELGIQTDNKFIVVNENYRTNIDGYYAIGNVINTPSLSHVASCEAMNCIEGIKGLNFQKIDYKNIPTCIYSHPEVSCVGYTEKESKKKGFQLQIAKFPFKSSIQSIVDEEIDGFVKVLFDKKYDEWLGCHIVGNNATNLISEVVIARKLETTSYELFNNTIPHPSLSELISESVSSAYGRSIYL
ncbi:dihydrolipoyl dehydrogenase [Blattabacterium cuenoti]|uniref:dihydrolipoyl dehydrogenase n=1 Tax=Blattabacterium cuenoti TaxID=1653831 RepID=UPI00163B6404|nr:dihydrolipoyl dehydrogenase [Blattabacterium cuenoti]